MYRVLSFFEKVAGKPLEAIEALVASSLFLSGLWLVSPFYTPDTSAVATLTGGHLIPAILGTIQIILFLPLAYALAKFSWPARDRVRSIITYLTFLLYMFYGMSQMLLYGMARVSWIATFTLALISGVAHLANKLKSAVVKKEDERY